MTGFEPRAFTGHGFCSILRRKVRKQYTFRVVEVRKLERCQVVELVIRFTHQSQGRYTECQLVYRIVRLWRIVVEPVLPSHDCVGVVGGIKYMWIGILCASAGEQEGKTVQVRWVCGRKRA
jgi:hypothetical protein